jgi:hypothetical protein
MCAGKKKAQAANYLGFLFGGVDGKHRQKPKTFQSYCL